MEQLRAGGQIIGQGSGEDRFLTAICLAWGRPRFNASKAGGNSELLNEVYRLLAERGLSLFFACTGATDMKYRRIGDDLYLFALLDDGVHHPERAFRSHVWDVAAHWQEHAERELAQCGVPSGEASLLLGIGAVPCDDGGYGTDLMYEAAKRALIQAHRDGEHRQGPKARSLRNLLSGRLLFPVYQPIVSLQEDALFGYEALTRLPGESGFEGPLELFRFAGEIGEAYRLDRLARELAINGCARLHEDQKLFINVMAQIMEDPRFSPGRTLGLLEEHHLSPRQVVFEINERSSIEDYPAMQKALEHYRSQGYQIAIDDVGAGYSSLQSIVELRPDYIKVDRSIIQDIHNDEVKEHILHTLQEASDKIGAALIAEGIERQDELDKLREMGIRYAQGYLIGRPAPFPDRQS